MARIGNYIHAHRENYRTFGTQQQEPGDYDQSDTIISQTMGKYTRKTPRISNRDQEQLAQFLNALLYKQEKSRDAIDDEVWEKIEPKIYEAFQTKYNGFNLTESLGVYRQAKKITDNTNTITINRANSIVKSLNKVVTGLTSGAIQKKGLDVSAAQKEIERTIKQLNSLIDQHSQDKSEKIDLNNINGLKDSINKALGLLSFNLTMIGDAFEMWLQGAAAAIQNNVDIAVDKIGNTLGSTTSRAGVNINAFDEELVDLNSLAEMTDMSYTNGSTRIESKVSSQNKADLAITWNNQTLMVSAKNYGFSSSNLVSLVSGTNLFTILLNENASFVNHVLNITTLNDTNHLDQAHKAIKLITLWKAITGAGLGKNNTSNTFILNNRKLKTIYVLDAVRLYQQLIKVIDQGVEFTFSGNETELAGINRWIGGPTPDANQAKQRITTLLAKLHAYKVGVKFDASQIGLTK